MVTIEASVGIGGANRPGDVSQIQMLLQRHVRWLEGATVKINGHADPLTCQAIGTFQRNAAALLKPDSLVSPNGFTLRWLNRPVISPLRHQVFVLTCIDHAVGLTAVDYARAAANVKCEAAVVQAVAETETRRAAWVDDGRPTILFERHYFSRLSRHQFDRSHPDISNPTPGGYGLSSGQWSRLRRAAMLDETAALQAASWGAFQIMGENYNECGFASVDAFVDAMVAGEQQQLDAFIAYVKHDLRRVKAMQQRDWATFAQLYNGPDYADNDYDSKMAEAYAKLSAAASRKQPGR
jgi:N-acetylmuramidase